MNARAPHPQLNPKEIRTRLGLNQREFWARLGVTQSGGSRYESGRSMPRPVQELLRLVHVEQIELSRLRREDLEVLDHLKAHHPELLAKLSKAIQEKARQMALPVAEHRPEQRESFL